MHLDFGSALELSVVSMLIVFFTLYGISLVLSSFEKIFKEKEEVKEVVKKDKIQKEIVEEILDQEKITYEQLEEDEDMLVAAIVASMEAAKENKNSNFKVVRIRQINN